MFCIYFCLRGIISNGILWSGRIDLLVRPDHFMVGPKTTRHRLSGIVACLLTPTPAFHLSLTIATYLLSFIHSFIQSFMLFSIAHFQVHFYLEALLTQHEYCVGVSRRSATGNCESRTCPTSLSDRYNWT